MSWISGFGRDESGHLGVKVQAADGTSTLAGLERVGASLGRAARGWRRATFALQSLRRGDTASFLHGLGQDTWDASAQPVYEVDCDFGTLVIPAQLLVLSVLCPQAPLRGTLLKPWGPSCLMTTMREGNAIETRRTPKSPKTDTSYFDWIEQRVQWIQTHPSASAAWGSVFRNALAGQLEMSLPRATIVCSVNTLRVDNKFLATRMQVQKLRPEEVPHEFALGCTLPEYVFFEEAIYKTCPSQKVLRGDTRFAMNGIVAPMTDTEWHLVEAVIPFNLRPRVASLVDHRRKQSLRAVIDTIRLKLGTPCAWSACPGDKGLVQSASVLLSKLERAGIWELIVDVLTTCEQPNCVQPYPAGSPDTGHCAPIFTETHTVLG